MRMAQCEMTFYVHRMTYCGVPDNKNNMTSSCLRALPRNYNDQKTLSCDMFVHACAMGVTDAMSRQ